MIETNRNNGMRSEASIGLSRPAVQPIRMTITRMSGRIAGGSANVASRMSPKPRSLVIGLRRCSQLVPGR